MAHEAIAEARAPREEGTGGGIRRRPITRRRRGTAERGKLVVDARKHCLPAQRPSMGVISKGIGHTSCILAQRPGMGVMLNTQGEPRDGGIRSWMPERLGRERRYWRKSTRPSQASNSSRDRPRTDRRVDQRSARRDSGRPRSPERVSRAPGELGSRLHRWIPSGITDSRCVVKTH